MGGLETRSFDSPEEVRPWGEAGPNEVVRAEPGHDAWVVGDEPCFVVDFGVSSSYARPA